MAFTPINFLNARTTSSGGIGDVLGDLLRGYQTSKVPGQMRQEEERQAAAIRLQEAMAEKERTYGGLSALSGPARDYQSLVIAENMYGRDHPIVQQIRSALEQQSQHKSDLHDYYSIMNRSAPQRHATGAAKTNLEIEDLKAGFLPGTNRSVPLNEQQLEKLSGQYGLDVLKRTTDPFTRRSLEQANNVHRTLETLNVDDLTRYSGVIGAIEKKLEEGKSITNAESEQFKKYHEAETSAKSLAKQIRQLLGDSVTVTAQGALDALANPSSLKLSPEVAKRKFNQYVKILENEIDTFRKSAKSPEVFYGEDEDQNKLARLMMESERSNQGNSMTLIHDGQSYDVPLDQVEEFKMWANRKKRVPNEG